MLCVPSNWYTTRDEGMGTCSFKRNNLLLLLLAKYIYVWKMKKMSLRKKFMTTVEITFILLSLFSVPFFYLFIFIAYSSTVLERVVLAPEKKNTGRFMG